MRRVKRFPSIRYIVRHGLVGHTVRLAIASVGLEIIPYTWFLEDAEREGTPATSGRPVRELYAADVERLFVTSELEGRVGYSLRRLARGDRCYGIFEGERLLGFSWCNFDGSEVKFRKLELEPWEAYSYDTYVLAAERGKNVAPELLVRMYPLLEGVGVTKLHSYADSQNRPAVRLKEKIGASTIEKGIYVSMKGRHWHKVIWSLEPKTVLGKPRNVAAA